MKNIERDFRNKLEIVYVLLVVVVIALMYFGKEQYTSTVTNWAGSIIVALFTTAASQSIVQRFTNGALEKMFLKVRIRGKEYSISLFILVSIIVKYLLFK